MKRILFVLALALAAAIGFGVGLQVGRNHAAKAGVSNLTGSPSSLSNSGPASAAEPGGSVATNKFLTFLELEQALTELVRHPREDYWRRLHEIVQAMDPGDIPVLMAKLPTLWSISGLREMLLRRWGASDAHQAMDFANAIKEPNERRLAMVQVLRGWIELDLASAAAWAKRLPPGQLQGEALAVVAPALAAKDPEAALALLEPTFGRGYGDGVRELFETWSARDPAAAAAHAVQMKNWLARQSAYGIIARNWAARDLPTALAWGKSLRDRRDRASVLGDMMGAWTTSDPHAAADYAVSLSDDSRELLLGKVATSWAQRDLSAAVDWMKQLPDNDQMAVLQTLKFQWTANDPQSAAAYGLALPAGSTQNNFLNQVARSWAAANPKAAVEWLAQVPEGSQRFSAINGIAAGWAETSPQEAANFVASLPSGKIQEAAARNVLFKWQMDDPGSAANWVAQFPEGDLRRETMENLVSFWSRNDPAAAGKYLENLPVGKSRESAILTYINQAALQSPEFAGPFVNQIADENQRFSSAQAVSRSYQRSDPAGYAQWRAALNLPEDKLKLLPKPGP